MNGPLGEQCVFGEHSVISPLGEPSFDGIGYGSRKARGLPWCVLRTVRSASSPRLANRPHSVNSVFGEQCVLGELSVFGGKSVLGEEHAFSEQSAPSAQSVRRAVRAR